MSVWDADEAVYFRPPVRFTYQEYNQIPRALDGDLLTSSMWNDVVGNLDLLWDKVMT